MKLAGKSRCLIYNTNMKDYVFYFRKKLRKEEIDITYLDEDFINNFMCENKLFGEDIFNELLEELHKYQIAQEPFYF